MYIVCHGERREGRRGGRKEREEEREEGGILLAKKQCTKLEALGVPERYLALPIPRSRLNARNAPGARPYCNHQPLTNFADRTKA